MIKIDNKIFFRNLILTLLLIIGYLFFENKTLSNNLDKTNILLNEYIQKGLKDKVNIDKGTI